MEVLVWLYHMAIAIVTLVIGVLTIWKLVVDILNGLQQFLVNRRKSSHGPNQRK